MARPQYEKDEDRKNEEIVRVNLQKHLICNLEKMPVSYNADYAGFRGTLFCFVEIKCRSHSRTEFDTLIISLLKVRSGISLAELTGVPFYLAIRFDDGLFIVNVTSELVRRSDIKWGGRTEKRRDEADVEPVIHIRVSEMERIGDAPEWLKVETPKSVPESALEKARTKSHDN